MSIPFNYKLAPVASTASLAQDLPQNNRDWIVWSYNGIYKNKADGHQPLVNIGFRELYPNSVSDHVIHQNIGLTYAGQLRIGSVWNKGLNSRCVLFDSSTVFDVDFRRGGWEIASFYDYRKGQSREPYPFEIYPLKHFKDGNKYIIFNLNNGGKLVVPCIEFFSRCYGRAQEIKRVLATYPWSGGADSVLDRLYAPLDEPEEPGLWKVKLRKRFVNSDAVFLAHVKYDEDARRAAKFINAQLNVKYEPNPSTPIFLSVIPWYQDNAKISVRGIWFDDRRSFLALQVVGCSDPNGDPIQRDRENTSKTLQPSDTDNTAWAGTKSKKIIKPPQIVDLTSNDAPDHSCGGVDILDQEFKIIGQPRLVTDKYRDQAKTRSGGKSGFTDESAFSSSDLSGQDKDVGLASIYAETTIESHGMLNDMWNAANYWKDRLPDKIKNVEYFTLQDGFDRGAIPKLIVLPHFLPDEEVDNNVRKWLYLDPQTPRGVLVMRFTVTQEHDGGDVFVYILEIQRKFKNSGNKLTNKPEVKEDSLSGLVFSIDNEKQLRDWLHVFLAQIRYEQGKMKNLVGFYPHRAKYFKHGKAQNQEICCQSTIMSALNKLVGISNR